jgi:hypothetical protein
VPGYSVSSEQARGSGSDRDWHRGKRHHAQQKEEGKTMAHDTGMTKGNKEHGHMTITHLEHISDTCQKYLSALQSLKETGEA